MSRMTRTLVRVVSIAQSGHLMVVVPAFSHKAIFAIPFDAVPQHVLDTIEDLPKRLHARVNLDAEDIGDVRFEDWEAK